MTKPNGVGPAEKCATCGQCCKTCPGAAFPCDLGSSEDDVKLQILERLESGKWAVDWWEGDPREGPEDGPDRLSQAFYIRPAVVGTTRRFHGTWGGVCTFLGPDGCDLVMEQRPRECATLDPADCNLTGGLPKKRDKKYTKQQAAMMWIPYLEFFESIPRTGSLQEMIEGYKHRKLGL